MLKAYERITITNLAENGGILERKGYQKPRREGAKKEIRRLLISECLTNKQIAERVNIPLRSVERYIAEIYEHDNRLIADINSDEQVLTDINVARDRLAAHKQEMLNELRSESYKNAPLKHKVEYWHLICELEAADMRFSQCAPSMLARRTQLPSGYNLPELMH